MLGLRVLGSRPDLDITSTHAELRLDESDSLVLEGGGRPLAEGVINTSPESLRATSAN